MNYNLRDDAWEKAKKTTMMFEGSGYGTIGGNFDGMGLSLGFLQWNLGQGTLQPLFIKLFNECSSVAKNALEDGADIIKNTISQGTILSYAIQSMNSSNNKIIEPWYSRFVKLCETAEFRTIQDYYANSYKYKAISMCKRFEIFTDRAFCLLFDIAVQNGSVIKPPDLSDMNTFDKMKALINAVVAQSDKRWQNDVRLRKEAILYGNGIIHGQKVRLDFNDTMAFGREIDEAVGILKDYGIVSSPDYWIQNSKPGGTIKGEYAAKLIINIASELEQGDMLMGALQILKDHKIVVSPDYWQKSAVKTGSVNGEYVATLIHKATEELEIKS